jgi:hypothetical protein
MSKWNLLTDQMKIFTSLELHSEAEYAPHRSLTCSGLYTVM